MLEKLKALFCLSVVLIILFFPILFDKKILLPLDQLNTMFYPYSDKYEKVEVFNHFLSDGLTQYYPYKLFIREALQTRNLALWNPNELCGFPQYAQTMAAHFDVTNIVLPFLPMPSAYHLQIILQFLIAGMGMFLLLRSYKISFWIAIFFATAYMLNSIFIINIIHRWILASFCWMPYVLTMLKQYLEKKDMASFFSATLFLSFFFLGGNFQTSIFGIVVVLVFLWTENFNAQLFSFRSILFRSINLILIAFLIAAIMFLPSLELLWADISDGIARVWKKNTSTIIDRILSIPMVLSFYFPQLLGSVRAYDLSKIANNTLNDFSGFIGFAPLFFAVWGSYYLWNVKTESRSYSLFIIIGVILPLFTPLLSLFYHRFFIVTVLGTVVVGAMAMQTFVEKNSIWESFQKYYKGNIIIFLGIFFCLLAATIFISVEYDNLFESAKKFIIQRMSQGQGAFSVNKDWMINRIHITMQHFLLTSPSMYLPLLSITAILVLTYLFKKKTIIRKNIYTISVYGITIIQLFQFSWSWIPMSDVEQYPLFPITEEIKYIQADADDFRVLPYNDNSNVGQKLIPSNILSNVYNIATLDGYESIEMPNFNSFSGQTQRNIKLNANYLGLANVKYILTNNQIVIDSSKAFQLVKKGSVNIYKNEKYLPRINMRYKYRIYHDVKEMVEQFYSNNYDPETVFFKDEPLIRINHQNVKNRVNLIIEENNYLNINVYSEKEGYLILSDTFYPGWECRINGKKTQITKANYSMRSVVVPAGNSVVEFEFNPITFRIGMIITFISSMVTAFFIYRQK